MDGVTLSFTSKRSKLIKLTLTSEYNPPRSIHFGESASPPLGVITAGPYIPYRLNATLEIVQI